MRGLIGCAVTALVVLLAFSGAVSAADTWTTVAPLLTARFDLGAATGPDGRIYVIGGATAGGYKNPSTIVAAVEAYDPVAGAWQTLGPMRTPRAAFGTATGLDGRIYTFGGSNGTDCLNTAEAYNPATNSWTVLAAMPTARCSVAATRGVDGRIYVIGGWDPSNPWGLATVEVFNPDSGTWDTSIAPLPTPRWAPAAVTGTDGRVYALGGNYANNPRPTVEVYNPADNQWTSLDDMLTSRTTPAAVVGRDGKIVVIGGYTPSATETVETYDPRSGERSLDMPALSAARGALAATVGLDGSIYAIGGRSTSAAVNTVEVLTPTTPSDTTPPVTTAGVDGPAGLGGWYTGPVSVTLTASDGSGGSGVASTEYRLDAGATQSYSGPIVLASDGTHTLEFRSIDAAGNVEPWQTLVIQIDATPPAVNCAAPDTQWHGNDVALACGATDDTSGFADVSDAAFTLSTAVPAGTETADAITGSRVVCDVAGNCATSGPIGGIQVDKKTPGLSASATSDGSVYTPGTWVTTPVTVTFTCQDGGSGVAVGSPTPPITLNSPGADQSVTGICADRVGNTASVTFSGINIRADLSPTTADLAGPLGSGGWYVGPVTVTLFPGAGAVSSEYRIDGGVIGQYAGPFSVAGDGMRTVEFRSIDGLGSLEEWRTVSVSIDGTAPAVDCVAPDPLWHAENVALGCTAADGLSGLADPTLDAAFVLSTAVPDGLETGDAPTDLRTVCDVAGNCATAGPIGGNHIDRKPPSLTVSATSGGSPYTPGTWATQPVTVIFTCADGGSGIGSCPGPATLDADGAGQSIDGTATDAVGNSASAALDNIDIDRTAPATSVSMSPEPNAQGWHHGPVTLTLASVDSLSGIQATYFTVDGGPAQTYAGPSLILDADGVHEVRFWSVDVAGNSEAERSVTIRIDTTPPTTVASLAGPLGNGGWYTGPLTVTLTADDPAAATSYRLDDGPETLYSNPFAVGDEGTHVVRFRSVSAAGTAEEWRSISLAIDASPPVILCDAPDDAWHGAAVTLPCTAVDPGSGLADAQSDAAFGLSTSVPAGEETADATTGSRVVCDAAGNCATVGPIGGIKIDRRPPEITLAAPAGAYLLRQAVQAAYGCADSGSGITSCAGTTPSGAAIDTSSVGTSSFTVTAVDGAGNAASQTVTYTVSYGVRLLYDPSRSSLGGTWAWLWLALTDADGNNVSAPSIAVHALAVELAGGQGTGAMARLDRDFTYLRWPVGGGVYTLLVGTAGLPNGPYVVTFTVGDDPVVHTAPLVVRGWRPW